MKSALVNGVLIPPTSKISAQLREQQLAHEIGKLRGSLENLTGRAFDDAEACLRGLGSEYRQLAAWMRRKGIEPLPPRKAREVQDGPDKWAAFWAE